MSRLLDREPRSPAAPSPTPRLVTASDQPHPSPHAADGAAFSINFVRHHTLPLPLRRALTYAGLGYLVCQAALAVALLLMAASARSQRRQLQAQLHKRPISSTGAPAALQREMQQLQQRSRQQLAQMQAVVARQQQRFPVGRKLAAIASTLPARTWIISLAGDRAGRTLTIQAAYLIDPEHPYEMPTKSWIEALKADAAFGQGLKRLELQQSSRKAQGRASLFVFDLLAEWGA